MVCCLFMYWVADATNRTTFGISPLMESLLLLTCIQYYRGHWSLNVPINILRGVIILKSFHRATPFSLMIFDIYKAKNLIVFFLCVIILLFSFTTTPSMQPSTHEIACIELIFNPSFHPSFF